MYVKFICVSVYDLILKLYHLIMNCIIILILLFFHLAHLVFKNHLNIIWDISSLNFHCSSHICPPIECRGHKRPSRDFLSHEPGDSQLYADTILCAFQETVVPLLN